MYLLERNIHHAPVFLCVLRYSCGRMDVGMWAIRLWWGGVGFPSVSLVSAFDASSGTLPRTCAVVARPPRLCSTRGYRRRMKFAYFAKQRKKLMQDLGINAVLALAAACGSNRVARLDEWLRRVAGCSVCRCRCSKVVNP